MRRLLHVLLLAYALCVAGFVAGNGDAAEARDAG